MKWYGAIGFVKAVEDNPGVWIEQVIEKKYRGDLIRNSRRLQSGEKVNDDINISNSISIVADPYIRENFHAIRYADFMGSKWKITDIEVSYPRLTLTLGGLYHGEAEMGTSGCT